MVMTLLKRLKEHFENTPNLREEKRIMLDACTNVDWVMC